MVDLRKLPKWLMAAGVALSLWVKHESRTNAVETASIVSAVVCFAAFLVLWKLEQMLEGLGFVLGGVLKINRRLSDRDDDED